VSAICQSCASWPAVAVGLPLPPPFFLALAMFVSLSVTPIE
jgi:hypothetical protein